MIKKTFLPITLLILLGVTGCVPRDYLREDMQKHSASLYMYKSTPTDKTYANHREALLKIIKRSTKRGDKVPPGIYAEYGFFFFKEGEYEEAKKYFSLEKELYPESSVFMDRISSSGDRVKANLDKGE